MSFHSHVLPQGHFEWSPQKTTHHYQSAKQTTYYPSPNSYTYKTGFVEYNGESLKKELNNQHQYGKTQGNQMFSKNQYFFAGQNFVQNPLKQSNTHYQMKESAEEPKSIHFHKFNKIENTYSCQPATPNITVEKFLPNQSNFEQTATSGVDSKQEFMKGEKETINNKDNNFESESKNYQDLSSSKSFTNYTRVTEGDYSEDFGFKSRFSSNNILFTNETPAKNNGTKYENILESGNKCFYEYSPKLVQSEIQYEIENKGSNSHPSQKLEKKEFIDENRLRVELQAQIDHTKIEISNLKFKKELALSQVAKIKTKNDLAKTKSNKVAIQLGDNVGRLQKLEQRIDGLEEELIEVKNKKGNNLYGECLKETLNSKNKEINKLNEKVESSKKEIENELKALNEEKAKFTEFKKQIAHNHIDKQKNQENELKDLKLELVKVELKLEVAVRENKSQDEFFFEHLLSKTESKSEKQEIFLMMEKNMIRGSIEGLWEKLLGEQKEIGKLRERLWKPQSGGY